MPTCSVNVYLHTFISVNAYIYIVYISTNIMMFSYYAYIQHNKRCVYLDTKLNVSLNQQVLGIG